MAISVAASGASAADLPNRAGAPPTPQGLAVCSVGGMTGFVLPGSDTCARISGYVAAETQMGTLANQFGLFFTGTPGASPVTLGVLVPPAQRDDFGFATHGDVAFDLRSNTAYGPLRGFIEVLATGSTGFDANGNATVLNLGYVQFAGLTAGRVGSYFSYLAGGALEFDFFSPDRVNGNQPLLIAYTAPFGSGFSATLSLEEPTGAEVNNGIDGGFANVYCGLRYPDVVGALRVDQPWGSAQVSGVAHDTNVTGVSGDTVDHWGAAALIGATLNLPMLGAGDKVGAQAVWSTAALGYSGIPNTAQSPWDQGFNLNGNGAIFQLTDALDYAPGSWSYPTAWSAAAYVEHRFTAQFAISPEISWAHVSYSGAPAMISANATSVLGGAVAHWTPVPHLDFQFQALAESTSQAIPASYSAPPAFIGHSWGLIGSLEIVRDF